MDTVFVNSIRVSVAYRTNSGMRTKASFNGILYTQGLSCDVYNAHDDDEHVVLVLASVNGDILNSTTVITLEEYEEIRELYDPYAGGRYHTGLLEKCGAENILKLR